MSEEETREAQVPRFPGITHSVFPGGGTVTVQEIPVEIPPPPQLQLEGGEGEGSRTGAVGGVPPVVDELPDLVEDESDDEEEEDDVVGGNNGGQDEEYVEFLLPRRSARVREAMGRGEEGSGPSETATGPRRSARLGGSILRVEALMAAEMHFENPGSYREAMGSTDAAKWEEAMQ